MYDISVAATAKSISNFLDVYNTLQRLANAVKRSINQLSYRNLMRMEIKLSMYADIDLLSFHSEGLIGILMPLRRERLDRIT